MNQLIILFLLLISTSSYGQILEKNNSIDGLEIEKHESGFRLIRSNDTINLKLQKPTLNDSSLIERIKVYTRRIESRERTEIVIEYYFSQGWFGSIDNESKGQIIVLDSISGKELFNCINNRMYCYGTDWTQGNEYASYSYEVQFNSDGSINIFDIQEQNGLPASRAIGDLGKLRADKKEGEYVYKSGKYVYVNP